MSWRSCAARLRRTSSRGEAALWAWPGSCISLHSIDCPQAFWTLLSFLCTLPSSSLLDL